jgi:hypothetical protein
VVLLSLYHLRTSSAVVEHAGKTRDEKAYHSSRITNQTIIRLEDREYRSVRGGPSIRPSSILMGTVPILSSQLDTFTNKLIHNNSPTSHLS